jgi:hypothetical protein
VPTGLLFNNEGTKAENAISPFKNPETARFCSVREQFYAHEEAREAAFLIGLIVATLRYSRADFRRCEMSREPIIKFPKEIL